MAQVSGRNSSLVVWDNTGASQNLSGDMNNVVMTFPRDNPESTTFGKDTKQKLFSFQDTTLSGTSIWNSGAAHVDTVLSGILSASQNTLVQFIPGGTISGCTMHSAYMQLQSYAVTDPMNGAVAVNYTFQGTTGYASKILNLFGSSIVGYWPMFESSGTVSHDLGGRSHIGAYTSVTLGQTGIGDSNTAPLFDGVNSFNNIFSTGLNTDFNGAEGTLAIWAKVDNVGVWTDNGVRILANFLVDINNYIQIQKYSDNVIYFTHDGSSTARSISKVTTTLDWFHLAYTWSASGAFVTGYFNGGLISTAGAPASIVGALSSGNTTVGAYSTLPLYPWSGNLAHALLLNRAATAAEVLVMAAVP